MANYAAELFDEYSLKINVVAIKPKFFINIDRLINNVERHYF